MNERLTYPVKLAECLAWAAGTLYNNRLLGGVKLASHNTFAFLQTSCRITESVWQKGLRYIEFGGYGPYRLHRWRGLEHQSRHRAEGLCDVVLRLLVVSLTSTCRWSQIQDQGRGYTHETVIIRDCGRYPFTV